MSGTILTIQTNANNDIFVTATGNIGMATGILAVQQLCEHAMKAQFGEMFLQPTDGLPTLADVWRTRNFAKWAAAARVTLAGIEGVVRVVSFTYSSNGDIFSYTAQILTIYSQTLLTISEALDNPA